METDTETMEVTVDRISNSGNPIAEERYDGNHIHVPGGEAGGTYEIELLDMGKGYSIGVADILPPDKKKTLKKAYEWEERKQGKRKKKSEKQKISEEIKKDGLKKRKENKEKKQKSDIMSRNSMFEKSDNLNSLLNGKL